MRDATENKQGMKWKCVPQLLEDPLKRLPTTRKNHFSPKFYISFNPYIKIDRYLFFSVIITP